ncbi:hypothetical protein [Defluviimonas sp. WL0075]|uniref:Uncharacterized protein n=1 Tax=Albidovulum sediminicola TaxID=2984331 RepID=A0ABT2Z7B3_9RHOB|nr:hypothetical protein [Defluviimonas sp. WL0075]MCV2866975.1 hypothetical protein [Defluviimonas sp. WL0075]
MSRWSNSFEQHEIHKTLKQVREWLGPDSDIVDAEHLAERRRLSKGIEAISKIVGGLDPELYPEQALTQLSQQLRHQHFWHQLSSYSANRSTNPLQVANNHLSSQMPSVAQLASVSRQSKARDAIRAVEAALDEFCKAVASRDEQFAARLGQHEGKLSELEQRSRELGDTLKSLRTNFETAMSAWQTAFTDDQTNRAEEYSGAQIERANEFANSLRKWRDIAEQEVKAIKTHYDKALVKELERFRDEVGARLADVRDKHAAILEIHGLVGTDGVAGGYQRGATEEHDSANLWRNIAMGSFALAVTCHGIFPPPAIRVRPNEGTDDEANEIQRRADHRHSGRA